MRMLSRLLVMMLVLTAACSGSSGDDDSSKNVSTENACSEVGLKVANGQTCALGDDPTASPLVRLEIIDESGGLGLCTGSVIDSNVVLTAAHCLQGNPISIQVSTFAGSFTASSFVNHPGFTATQSGSSLLFFNDAALVFTSETIPTQVTPLLLSRAPQVGEEVIIGGFGELSPDGDAGFAVAGAALVTGVTNDHIFISFEGNQAHPCVGDSGGPILFDVGGSNAVAGVVSQSDPSVDPNTICRPGDITLYTNLQNSGVLDFITGLVPAVPVL